MRDPAKRREEESEEAGTWRLGLQPGSGSDDESSDDSDSESERNIRAVTAPTEASTTTTATSTTTAASPVTRAKWLSQAGLRVGFSSIPDQIYRKSLRKGGITVFSSTDIPLNLKLSCFVRIPVCDPGAGRVWAGQVHSDQLLVPDRRPGQRRHLLQAGENQGDTRTQGMWDLEGVFIFSPESGVHECSLLLLFV